MKNPSLTAGPVVAPLTGTEPRPATASAGSHWIARFWGLGLGLPGDGHARQADPVWGDTLPIVTFPKRENRLRRRPRPHDPSLMASRDKVAQHASRMEQPPILLAQITCCLNSVAHIVVARIPEAIECVHQRACATVLWLGSAVAVSVAWR
jgi:hypothetical protein